MKNDYSHRNVRFGVVSRLVESLVQFFFDYPNKRGVTINRRRYKQMIDDFFEVST